MSHVTSFLFSCACMHAYVFVCVCVCVCVRVCVCVPKWRVRIEMRACELDATEIATPPKSIKSRNSNSLVLIQIKPKSSIGVCLYESLRMRVSKDHREACVCCALVCVYMCIDTCCALMMFKHTYKQGWRRCVRRLIFIVHFPQKIPIISGSLAERDLQL